MEGLLILLAGAMTAIMNQIWFTHQQAGPTEWRFCSLFMITPIIHSAPHISQLWGQFTTAFIKEGDESIISTEIQKVAWDNATKFEREFHSWW